MESECGAALSGVCRAVTIAIERFEEERSPSSIDILTFHVNELYRFLLVYCDDELLEDVGRSMAIITEIESTSATNTMGFEAPLVSCHSLRGRPRFSISKEQIEHLLSLNFTCPRIATLLGVSLRTVRRRMTEYGLSVSGLYSDISDHELGRLVNEIHTSFPNCGYRMMDGHLRQRGIRVTQDRIKQVLHQTDPEGVVLRWRQAIHRRKYSVAGPLSLWHIDGNHKLIR